MNTFDYDIILDILEEIHNNSYITEKELTNVTNLSERTVRRYIKILKDNNLIELSIVGKNRKWYIII